ncbi:MAG: methyltransferase domain-containing protein [Deltaproteobacteria bacterium]|nr:methyltransferase domain-containing protein [Deltaproteobacteria bacterium]
MVSHPVLPSKYETTTTDIRVADKSLTFLQIRNMDAVIGELLKPGKKGEGERPFWAKIWESSVLLAHLLSMLPVKSDASMLEIGCGMGVAGLFASAFGHDTILTDINEDALAFARANAALNGLEDTRIVRLDWGSDRLERRFDMIFGSDVLYTDGSYGLLIEFLKAHLKPDGKVVLAVSGFISAATFFKEAEPVFKIGKKTYALRSDTRSHSIFLYTLEYP